LLREAAKRLQHCVRQSDTVARLGGDEFVIAVSGLEDGAKAAVIAQSVIAKLQLPFHLNGHQLYMGASLGISLFPDHANDSDALMQAADQAMYHAKQAGGGNYQFHGNESSAEPCGSALGFSDRSTKPEGL
jgi:diguanylate cyclase (GGDEF)-like protein